MIKSRFTDEEKKQILKMKSVLGLTAEELCAKNGISIATYYVWKRKFSSQKKTNNSLHPRIVDGDYKKLRELYINLSEHNHNLAQFIKSK